MVSTHPQQTGAPNSAHGRPMVSRAIDRRCLALHEDGSDCQEVLVRFSHTLCSSHRQEYKKLKRAYKLQEKHYDSIDAREGEAGSTDKIEAKLAAGKKTLELRDQVNRRFFNFSAQNRGHIKWILKLQSEVRGLQQRLAVGQAGEPVSLLEPAQEDRNPETRVSRPRLELTTPGPASRQLPPHSPAIVVKQALNAISAEMVRKLYSIAPSLDDSSPVVLDEVTREEREPDERDFVIRFLFRELLVCKADAEVLASATRTQNIDTFLRQSSVEYFQLYFSFFEAFRNGRDDTFRLLRDAVCDYLLDPQSISTTTILGAEIAAEDGARTMSTRGWDILWVEFNDIVNWWNLEFFAVQFEDLVAVKTLIACQRYGPGESGGGGNDEPNWYVPDEDVSQECVLGVIQGFIAVAKGFYGSDVPTVETKHGIVKETQTRCYLVGRMSNKDPWAQQLAQELSRRVVRFQVLVYDREKEPARIPQVISSSTNEDNLWIKRSRSAPAKEALNAQTWTTEWSVENILDDLGLVHVLRDRNMARDYYEFIIIDRTPGREFDILDVVADALSKLKGDPAYEQVCKQAIKKYVPAEEQTESLQAISHMDFRQATSSASHRYLDSRVRCWDVPGPLNNIIGALVRDSSRVVTRSDSRLVSQVAADLESRGVISPILEYEPPLSRPVVVSGVDGLSDLYFSYDLGPRNEQSFRGSILDFDPSSNNLLEFSQSYQRAHAGAVFAKGSINVHYCAWPMPMLPGPRYSRLNFCTPDGHLYRWKALPFDLPMASRIWQIYVDHEINSKLPFVRLVQTTLVVCAEDREAASANLQALIDIGKDHGWKFSVPSPYLWTKDIKRLGLGSLWEGARPAL